MKSNNLINKIWGYLIIFALTTISFLWLFQVIFLDSYYEWYKVREIDKIADKLTKSKNIDSIKQTLDDFSFKEGICIDVIYYNSEVYSSNSLNRGCMGLSSNDPTYLQNKIDFRNSNRDKKVYKMVNPRFNNKIVMYGVKLTDDYYIFINSSIEALSSTTNILGSQLVYVTIIVIILSLVISYFISKRISKPIIKINNTAKKMAKGNYNVKFEINENIHELNELVETLNETNEQLSKTDTVRRELLANISHDLKTPLTMIKAYAEMIKDISYNDKNKTFNNLNTIIEETDRLNLLVNDILDLSKIQANSESITLEEFDLNLLIESVLSRFSYLEETKKYKIEYNYKKNIIIKADKKKIEQVIYNLISNASNYVGKDKLIIVNIFENKSNYRVEVIDHGKGINEEDLNLIWDKYYKIDKTHNRNRVGTGLGLSIVKNILELHNYNFGVNSEKNKGTTFYFEIKR